MAIKRVVYGTLYAKCILQEKEYFRHDFYSMNLYIVVNILMYALISIK